MKYLVAFCFCVLSFSAGVYVQTQLQKAQAQPAPRIVIYAKDLRCWKGDATNWNLYGQFEIREGK